MANCCACFGPNDGYFLNSPTKWSQDGLPLGLRRLFTEEPKVREVHEMALGPDGAFAATHTSTNGKLLITRSGLPDGLERWLIPKAGGSVSAQRDLRTLQIALGPGKSYFAYDKNGSAWGNLPAALNTAIEQKRDSKGRFKAGEGPQSVTLGADGAYVFTTTGGGGAWNLNGTADDLNTFLHNSKSLKDLCVILSPSRPGVYLVVFGNGNCSATLPDGTMPQFNIFAADWKQACQTALSQPQRAAVVQNRQGQTIRNSVSLGRSIVKGLGLVNNILNAANGNGGGGGYSGGGGDVFVSDTTYVDSGNTFWQPIQSAASDPIQ